jgi:hypothetical protein
MTMPRRSIASQIGPEPVDVLTTRPTKARRDRSWEKKQREKVGLVAYRGIPASLNAQIKAVAGELGVPVGDVARAFLEYGLEAYRNGALELTPELATGRYTLFSREGG